MVVRRVGPISCAKVVGILYAVLGVVAGAGVSLFSLLGEMVSRHPERAAPSALFGAAAVVLFPVMYGIGGFVMTLIGAWLYNVVAELVGGIEVDIR
jgi:hypothetical protein